MRRMGEKELNEEQLEHNEKLEYAASDLIDILTDGQCIFEGNIPLNAIWDVIVVAAGIAKVHGYRVHLPSHIVDGDIEYTIDYLDEEINDNKENDDENNQ